MAMPAPAVACCSRAEARGALLASVCRLVSKSLIVPTVTGTSGLAISPIHKERKGTEALPEGSLSPVERLPASSPCASGWL